MSDIADAVQATLADYGWVKLTDAEREALANAAATCRSIGRSVAAWPENQWAGIIDGLLERAK